MEKQPVEIALRDLKLTQGEGAVAGFNLRKIKNKEIPYSRRKLGIVFQGFSVYSPTAARRKILSL